MATVSSALILALLGSFCAAEVQSVEVTAEHPDVFNSKEGDEGCLNEKAIRCKKEANLDHNVHENSHSTSPSILNNPLSNYSGCPQRHDQSPSVPGNDTVCAFGNIVHCDDCFNDLYVLICYCMYFNEEDNSTIIFVGKCFYTCFYYPELYFSLPLNGSQLSEVQCGRFNREGELCGRCKENHSLPVYSYQFLSCVDCQDYSYKNWVKYIANAFGPLTVFYIIVIACRVSATSAKLNAFILINQLVAMPAQMRVMLAIIANNPVTPSVQAVINTAFSLYGIWNLDFFRTFYEPFCLGST